MAARRFMKRAAGRLVATACGLLFAAAALAQAFTIADIRLQGLQRVSAGTVFNALPVQVGDTSDSLHAARGHARALRRPVEGAI